MKPLRVTLTISEKEYNFFMKGATLKNRTFWHAVHEELIKGFEKSPGSEECDGSRIRVRKDIDIPPHLGKVIKCHSKKLGIRPATLIYAIVFAKNIAELIKEK